jgi:hypothetical protein
MRPPVQRIPLAPQLSPQNNLQNPRRYVSPPIDPRRQVQPQIDPRTDQNTIQPQPQTQPKPSENRRATQIINGVQDIPVQRREINDNDLGVDLSQEMADTVPNRREFSRRALSPTNIEIVKTQAQKEKTSVANKVPEPFYVRNKLDVQNGGAVQKPERLDPTVATRPMRGRVNSQETPQQQIKKTGNPYLTATTDAGTDRSKSAGMNQPRLSKTDYLIQ